MALDFNLISEFTPIQRRSFEAASTLDMSPVAANPVILGEWLELNSSYQLLRGAGSPATVPSYCVLSQQGDTAVQAINKVPVAYMGAFEADTLIMDATGLTMGEALEVDDVTFGALTRRGLVQFTAGYVVGRVTRLPANNNGYLRFTRVES